MARRLTLKPKFKQAFEKHRIKLGIRDASIATLNEIIGPVEVSKRLGGYKIEYHPFSIECGDNENDFLEAALDFANRFTDKTER